MPRRFQDRFTKSIKREHTVVYMYNCTYVKKLPQQATQATPAATTWGPRVMLLRCVTGARLADLMRPGWQQSGPHSKVVEGGGLATDRASGDVASLFDAFFSSS